MSNWRATTNDARSTGVVCECTLILKLSFANESLRSFATS
jgi:hypothetical protein